MFYRYKNRMDEFKRITNLKDSPAKIDALEHFISQEEHILKTMLPPRLKSQALTSAIITLQSTQLRLHDEHSFSITDYLSNLFCR